MVFLPSESNPIPKKPFNPEKLSGINTNDVLNKFFNNTPADLFNSDNNFAQESLTKNFPDWIDATKLSTENQKNKTLFTRIKDLFAFLITFAKTHPLITVGFMMALALLIISFPIFGASLFGVSSISILGLNIPISGVLGILCIYYGVSMINLARRAAIKDELEHQLESQMEILKIFQQKLTGLQEEQLRKAEKDISKKETELGKRIIEISSTWIGQIKQKKQEIEELNNVLQSSRNNLEMFLTKNLEIDQKNKITEHIQKIDAEVKMGVYLCNENIEKDKEEIHIGVSPYKDLARSSINQDLHPLKPPYQDYEINKEWKSPLIKEFLKLDAKDNLELPAISPEQKMTSSRILTNIKDKLQTLTQGIKKFAKEHPFGITIIVLGALVALIALPVLFIWLGGFTSIFFFGTLSIIVIMQLIIYGFSMAYEGYNAITISRLNERIQESQSAMNLKQREMTLLFMKERDAILSQKKNKKTSFVDYSEHQVKKIEVGINSEIKKIEEESKRKQALINDCIKLYTEAMSTIFSQGSDVSPTFTAPLEGAEVVATN